MWKECREIIEGFKFQLPEVSKIEEQFNGISLSEEDEDSLWQSITEKENFRLFKKIRSLESFSRRKRQWICKEFCDKLQQLLEEFPTKHATIRRVFKISNSTYRRIVREDKEGSWSWRAIKRSERNSKILSKTEKVLIWAIVRPPRNPLTLEDI